MPDLSPADQKIVDEAIYEASQQAFHETKMIVSQAQRLFYEYWNTGGWNKGLKEGEKAFEKCMEMGEIIRKHSTNEFYRRTKKYDKKLKAKHSNIILPGARAWEPWRVPGQPA